MAPLDPKLVPGYDPEFVALFHAVQMDKAPHPSELSLETLRAGKQRVPAMVDPAPVKEIKDYAIKRDNGDELSARVWIPNGSKPDNGWPLFYHIHGGGWTIGSYDMEEPHFRYWAQEAQCAVLSVDYRMAPEHPFPTPINDCCAAYDWIVENASVLEIDKQKIVVGGTSAGANMATGVCHYVNQHPSKGLPKPVLQVMVVPPTDLRNVEERYKNHRLANAETLGYAMLKRLVETYIPDESQRADPRASPILNSDESFKNLPPAVIIAGGMDILQGDAVAYAKKLEDTGNELVYNKVLEGAVHGFIGLSGKVKRSRQALDAITEALKNALK